MPALNLSGFTYQELFTPDGLARLDDAFLAFLAKEKPACLEQLRCYREGAATLTPPEMSELLITCAHYLEQFLAGLFNIEEALAASEAKTLSHNPVSVFKKYFVLRRAKKDLNRASQLPSFTELNQWLEEALLGNPLKTDDKELAIALLGTRYLEDPEAFKVEIEQLVKWCVQALVTPEGQAFIKNWVSFRIPERIDHQNLVPTIILSDEACAYPESALRKRDGFKLTDPRMSAREVQDEINYCVYCHDHDGDFCSKGFPVKKGDPAQGFKKNPLDITLAGCPLEEKISEMHFLKQQGKTLAALAMVMVDNPMCPATGHRICNDCMKACIYQKQDPVNIPQIETRVLTDVLDLPWGVEIYDLLTRWNPLRQTQWVMKPYNGLKVMIAGMGPAGFTLAHHLLLEGFAVVGFDGLKIEPLPQHLINEPIYRFADLKEELDERLMAGFGGVAEYGITVRWDKNFLKLIYLSLMRRKHFQVFGGVRFGGTITVEDAWEMGFDHFVVAVGAGLPKALPIPGSLAPGMRQANDFLMALQLNNAAKANSLTNLQIRLPAVVIGGGLTGVDTATELQAYYVTQVEKIYRRYRTLIQKHGEAFVLEQFDSASRDILAEYLHHGEAITQEREAAKIENRQANFLKLTRAWGGVTIAYRRSMQESPAYLNNHEELKKALEEGIYYAQGLEPFAVELDTHGHAQALVCKKRERNEAKEWITTRQDVRLPARSILVATGTQPNTAYEFEHRGTFKRAKLQYLHFEDDAGQLKQIDETEHCKVAAFGPFTSYQLEDKRISLVGDTHPVFHGNVVKAIASGTRTYPKILALLKNKLSQIGSEKEYDQFATHMRELFTAEIQSVTRQTNHIIELTIKAPLAAKHFKAGQFYRLQNFETLSHSIGDTLLQMEPLAVVATEVDKEKGLLNFLVNETSVAAKLCATLKPHDRITLMGPTGVRAKIPEQPETILVVGNQGSFAFLRNLGSALRAHGSRVIYLAQLQHKEEVYCQTALENATDQIVWLTASDDLIKPTRAQDIAISGTNPITALTQLASQVPLTDINRIYISGNTELLRQFQALAQTELYSHLNSHPIVTGSVYGNMQCMLKGVCAQCLQWQIDPETKQRTKAVFACSWQDQPIELIDIDHLDERLQQNSVLEKVNKLWLEHVFETHEVKRV
jgi:NADPH-dependent glutamate synthase beta subunit-like oxidoreductase/NAD(P)H-flavin reductase